MGLFRDIGIQDNIFIPYLNTGTMYDLATGVFIPGSDGNVLLNGGLTFTNGIAGRPQMFKSTFALSLMMGAMSIYPRSESVVYDTEFAQKEDRILKLANNPLLPSPTDLEERLHLTDKTKYSTESFYELIRSIAAEKEKNKKDYMVQSPFIDIKTLKPRPMWIPTFVAVDSWSKMSSDAVKDIYASTNISSSDTNMVFMKEGAIKTKFMSQIPAMAASHGIYFIFTVHIGDKFVLDPYKSPPKDLQHMRGVDEIKGAGADFNFLTSTLMDMRSAEVLQTKLKECMYPDKHSSPTELNAVYGVICRCKNNTSGAQLSSIISQDSGLNAPLSNYDYLKKADYFGLIGGQQNHKPSLIDVNLSRTTVREKLSDYKTARAIEILTQFYYIRTNWITRGCPVDFNIPLEKFTEALLNNKSYVIDDLLNSRGYWTYDEKDKREYMSMFDIMFLIEGKSNKKSK